MAPTVEQTSIPPGQQPTPAVGIQPFEQSGVGVAVGGLGVEVAPKLQQIGLAGSVHEPLMTKPPFAGEHKELVVHLLGGTGHG